MPGTDAAYSRYVALGDSQTEGLGDGDDTTGLRGFADRLAEHLALGNPHFTYANLAVRGRLAAQVHAEQLAPALALRPDLATVVAGVNDFLRPRFDADHVAPRAARLLAGGRRRRCEAVLDQTGEDRFAQGVDGGLWADHDGE
ncbi:SGNH/GDSL hydrolase family protein, partial [Streptomyces sp. PRKS01-29]|nr:SGNH/GDSL hydrolase family protein [Streptomyces sabulosicollis]